ncbi:hypothetical protein [Pseudobdellovibrio sp. HCB154]|uniref:hypothetical protein n=1 Tax=Pseudobdellovibrio sp. HCB154 TaxID=3386277 RepID=UPI003916D0B2
MSKHVVLKTICVSLLGITFGYGITRVMHTEYEVSTRNTASIPLTKLGVDQASYDYIDLKIENVSLADKKEGTSLVQVRITALRDIPSALNYQWVLGKEVTTSEPLDGILEPLTQGQSKVFELRVQNYSKEWQSHVSMSLTGDLSGHQVRRDVIVSSRPEDSFEYVVQQAALAEEQAKKNSPSGKLQTLNNKKTLSEKFRKDKIIR